MATSIQFLSFIIINGSGHEEIYNLHFSVDNLGNAIILAGLVNEVPITVENQPNGAFINNKINITYFWENSGIKYKVILSQDSSSTDLYFTEESRSNDEDPWTFLRTATNILNAQYFISEHSYLTLTFTIDSYTNTLNLSVFGDENKIMILNGQFNGNTINFQEDQNPNGLFDGNTLEFTVRYPGHLVEIAVSNFDVLLINSTLEILYISVIDDQTLTSIGYDVSAENWSLVNTDEPVPCFEEHDMILILNSDSQEVYVPIKDLMVGDKVKTFNHGFRKIIHIIKGKAINDEDWNTGLFKMLKEGDMTDDLVLTGGHSILVDELSITEEEEKRQQEIYNGYVRDLNVDGKRLLLAAASNKFIKVTDREVYRYYHLVLDNEGEQNKIYGIWANNVLCETMTKEYYDTLKRMIY